jgi:hypothetical protein
MNALLVRAGQLVGLLGIVLMAVSVAARLAGRYWVWDFQAGTLLLGGAGAVTVGCFLLLWAMSERGQR